MKTRKELETELFDLTKKHKDWEILISFISNSEIIRLIEDMKEYNKDMYDDIVDMEEW
jgi:hypothetical protein